MKIDPGRPLPAAAPVRPREELERLAQDVCESGASFWVPRRISWFGHRRADASEVAAELAKPESRLKVTMPDCDARQPVLDESDLEEVAFFSGKGPAPSSDATRLNQLASVGFRLLDPEGNPLGVYGAYNALTDPAHRQCTVQGELRQARAPIQQAELGPIAEFYGQDTLGQLEAQGYQFYDTAGQPRLAWGDEPPARIGREQAWLEVRRPEELVGRLREFEQLLQETGDPGRALQLQELPPDTPALARPILQANTRNRAGLVPGLLRKLSHTPAEELKAIGREFATDPVSRKLFLEELARRPETAERAREALTAARCSASVASQGWDLFHTTTGSIYPGLLENLSYSYHEEKAADERTLAAGVLELNLSTPAGQRVHEWFAGQPTGQAARALLEHASASKPEELRTLAIETRGDAQVVERQLRDLDPRPEPLIELMQGFGAYGPALVGHTALRHPERDTPEKAAAFFREVDTQLSSKMWNVAECTPARTALRKAVFEGLASMPECRTAIDALQRWQPGEPADATMKALLQHPTASTPEQLRALALDAQGDEVVSSRQIAELVTDPAPVQDLLRQMGPESTPWVAKAALEHPERKTAEQAAAFYAAVKAPMDQNYWMGERMQPLRDALSRSAVKELGSKPEAAQALAAVRQWHSGEVPYEALAALLQHPTAASPQELRTLALESGGDKAARQRQIDQLVENPAPIKALLEQSEANGVQWVAQAALRHPARSTPEGVAAFYSDLKGSIDQASWMGEQLRPLQEAFSATALAELEPQPAVARLRAWHGGKVPYEAVGALLQNPTAATPAELGKVASEGGGTLEVRQRQVRELVCDPEPAVELMEAIGPQGQEWVARAALEHPDRSSLSDLQAYYRQIRAFLDPCTWMGAQHTAMTEKVAEAMETDLAGRKDCREAMERVRGWSGGKPDYTAMGAVLDHAQARTPDELRALALQAGGDRAARERQIGQLVNRPAPVLALLASGGAYGEAWVAQAALQHPQRSTPAELASFYGAIQASLDSNSWMAVQLAPLQEAVGRGFLAELKDTPDGKTAAEWLEAKGIQDWSRLTRALAQQPTANTLPERCKLAATILDPNETLQNQLLKDMAEDPETRSSADVATRLLQVARTPQARWAITMAALENPVLSELNGKTIGKRVEELLGSYSWYPGVAQDQAAIASLGAVAEEVLRLARGPEKSQTIREDADRVVVGGAVVRKKDEG